MAASQRVSRGYRLGLFLVAILLIVGLGLIVGLALAVADFLNPRLLWDRIRLDQLPMVVAGVLIGLGLACVALYGVVRTIGWVAWRHCRPAGWR
jgi:hypothetical protein